MASIQMRNSKLMNLGQMILDGQMAYKLDLIAKIQINNEPYFSVFRRYNSPYEILIEDERNDSDIYYHKDYTLRRSLSDVFCLPLGVMTVTGGMSYKHSAEIADLCLLDRNLLDMTWTEVQCKFEAINVNIRIDWPYFPPYDVKEEEVPRTPENQVVPNVVEACCAPRKHTKDEMDAADGLLLLSIPPYDCDYMSESDRPTLSMRFADIQNRKRDRSPCYCDMDEEEEADEEEEYDSNEESDEEHEGDFPESDVESDDEDDYIILRNGTKYRKISSD